MWRLARSQVRAHLGSLVGTAVVLALAAALLAASGVLVESGLRAPGPDLDGAGPDAGALTALAGSFIGTTVVVVVLVVAATVGLAMRPRQRDLAVLRAVGATRRDVRRLVAGELLLVTLVVAPLGALPGLAAVHLLTPLLVEAGMVPAGFSPTISPLPVLAAVLLLAPVALAAAALATRETLRQPPTAAVRAAAAEPREVGGTRRVLAVVTAVAGVTAAGTPLVVPGVMGGATAASSALLLVGAAALAGPVLVARTLGLPGRREGSRHPVVRLALAGTRGSARRLTAVVVPLAAVVAVGTVQTSTGDALERAAVQQLRDGLGSELVVTAPEGLSAEQVRQVADAPEVDAATALSTARVQVRTDEEDLGALAWESGQARVLPADTPAAAYDPGVVEGSLAGLADPGTLAVSRDAALLGGAGLGETVAVRLGDGRTTDLRVVAVYDRGLGFGDYTLGRATLDEHGLDRPVDTVLVSTADPEALEALEALAPVLRDQGGEVVTTEQYVAGATGVGAEQRVSSVLLLALLGFMLVGAGNALVMLTAGRRPEWSLLGRIGATRRQLVGVAAVESLVTAAAAVVIGTAAVLPAVVGVSLGLLGPALPVVDLATYGVLVALVVLVSVLSTVPTLAARTRSR
ncbi:FtsX-like permease family protein [Nocardioides marmotae]|uniref:FtsX-like permease family protein n=1 Tax=Nocardioides marmotae TaxID=2663857 RepID=UPI0012B54855|nr:ABC transporter permease [Nocardioides marmotae]MBC9733294.1 ABC transporter permease [Nocardioides marmotae]MTB84403.1 FtsX-like permease family protein [Nocardioides marmotae]